MLWGRSDVLAIIASRVLCGVAEVVHGRTVHGPKDGILYALVTDPFNLATAWDSGTRVARQAPIAVPFRVTYLIELRYFIGDVPIHFLKAREKALCSEKPSRKAMSHMVFTGFLIY